jgi:hypothetical protein
MDFTATNPDDVEQIYGNVRFIVSPRVWSVAERAIAHPDAFDPEGLPDIIRWDMIFMSNQALPPAEKPLQKRLQALLPLGDGIKSFGMFIPTRPDIEDDEKRSKLQAQLFFRVYSRTAGRPTISIITEDDLREGKTGKDAPDSPLGEYLGLDVTWSYSPEAARMMADHHDGDGARGGDTLAIDDAAFLYSLFLDGKGGHGVHELEVEPKRPKRRLEAAEQPILKMPST